MKVSSIIPILTGPLYYPRVEKINGLFREYVRFKHHNTCSRESLAELQLERLRKLLIHAQKHTPYYRRLFAERGFRPELIDSVDQLAILPVLTKKTIRERRIDMIADNIPGHRRHESYTSGTTGVKTDFCRSNLCRSQRLAIQWRSDVWVGWQPFTRVAYLWPALQDMRPTLSWKRRLLNDYVKMIRIYNAGSLNDERIAVLVADLMKFRPRLIRAFPSPAARIATYLRDHQLEIPSLKGVVSTGEPLSKEQRNLISEGFHAEVFNLYASREVGTIGAECRYHRGLHVASDSVFIEIEQKGEQNSGSIGNILITDLLNYAMPLIRYNIGDVGALTSEKCECGMPYPMMQNIVGRTSDCFIDKAGNYITPISLAHHLITEGPMVGQMQLIQLSPENILIRLTSDYPLTESAKNYYETTLKEIIAGLKSVQYEIVERIEAEPSGKYRFSISHLNSAESAPLGKQ